VTTDIKDFYLNIPMDEYEEMRIPVDFTPAEIMKQHNLAPLVYHALEENLAISNRQPDLLLIIALRLALPMTVKQKRSKAMDMRSTGARAFIPTAISSVLEGGALALADSSTKHHPAWHSKQLRSFYLYDASAPSRKLFDCL
jgi:hypothetical protein